MGTVIADVGAKYIFPKAVLMNLVLAVPFMDVQPINLGINIKKRNSIIKLPISYYA